MASLDEIYLVLALIDEDAVDTPQFAGLDTEMIVLKCLLLIRMAQLDINLGCSERGNSVVQLLNKKTFKITTPRAIEIAAEEIKAIGEEKYEYYRIDNMV